MDSGSSSASASASGGTGGAGHGLTAAERSDYERLRRAAGVRHRRVRRIGACVLLVLTLLLAPLAVVAAWVQDTVSDTDRYVQTVSPLSSDPAVQKVVTDRLTNRVTGNVDVKAVTDALAKALADAGAPPRVVDGAEALTGPLRGAVEDVVHRTVNGVVTSDTFQRVWESANRQAHAAVMNVLTGERTGVVRATGDTVVLDVGEVVDRVQQRLVDAGFEKAAAIPDTDRTVTLFETEHLSQAQDTMRLLDVLGVWLPVLTFVLAVLAVWVAPGHRLMLLVTAVGVGVMMALLLVALAVLRRVYLDAVPPAELPADAAAAIFDTFVRFLRESTRTLLVISVITALAAFLYGPGRVARAVRTAARRGAGGTGRGLNRAGLRTGGTGRWLATHQSWTTGVTIGAGALALLLWNGPTVGSVALVVALVLVVLAVLAVLAAAGPAPASPAADAEAHGPVSP
ncbi:hypothetical protein ACF068_28360 [Streptomyces sp. NPDC016309]|uniref:hypothetical protein n=1 Tax=Streptomyces sp. NPDC016309 TaxID=3364965 RepID=UPI00370224D2